MKLYQKLLLGFACVALLVSCVGYVAQQVNQRIERSVYQLAETAAEELAAAADLHAAYRESLDAVRRLTGPLQASERSTAERALAETLDRFEAASGRARSATTSGRSRAVAWGRTDLVQRQDRMLATLKAIDAGFHAYRGRAETLTTTGGGSARATFEADLEPEAEVILGRPLAQYREAARASVGTEAAAVQAQIRQADRLLFGAVLLGIGMTLVLGVLIANSIASPLSDITEATRALGRGRLDYRIRRRGDDEVGQLADALNRMAEDLGRITVSKQLLEDVLASMTDPLLVLDDDGAVRLANGAATGTLGYAPDALPGSPLASVLAEGDEAAERILARVRQHGGTGHLETSLRTREGAELPVVFSAARLRDADGGASGIVCVAKDITEQKLVERELVRARERAEDMARMKSSFLANMSHEIRTPLTGIIGSAQVLHDVSGGEAVEMASIIERAGLRLLTTINSVLDMARIEAGEFHPHAEPVAVAEEAADIAGVLYRLAEAKGLALEIVEDGEPVWAVTDVGFLHRIVTNLVGNAIKFTESGSVRVEVEADGLDAVLRVRDTGIGMSPEFLPHLFDEFRQESSGLQRSHEGTGLGLAITKRLVDLLDGTITVESVQGAGTAFEVRLPRHIPAPLALPPAAEAA